MRDELRVRRWLRGLIAVTLSLLCSLASLPLLAAQSDNCSSKGMACCRGGRQCCCRRAERSGVTGSGPVIVVARSCPANCGKAALNRGIAVSDAPPAAEAIAPAGAQPGHLTPRQLRPTVPVLSYQLQQRPPPSSPLSA